MSNNTDPHGVNVKTNAREAKRLSALISPTRSLEPTPARGVYYLAASDEVQAMRDAEFLTDNGAAVISVY